MRRVAYLYITHPRYRNHSSTISVGNDGLAVSTLWHAGAHRRASRRQDRPNITNDPKASVAHIAIARILARTNLLGGHRQYYYHV